MTDQSNSNHKTDFISEEILKIQELENELKKAFEEKEEAEKKLFQAEEKVLRATADVQNLRRRAEEERGKLRLDGGIEVLKPFIALLDHLILAFSHLPKEIEGNEWINGIRVIEKNFLESLTSLGVEFIEEEGVRFDAHIHESMIIDPNTQKEIISKVFEKGVKYKGILIRPAKVSVGSLE